MRGRALKPRWPELVSLLTLFCALMALTWMRWPDALVDFWRNLYIPWRLSEGALLYTEVADWYGPLPSLVAGAAFSLFGPGLDVLVAINLAVAIACLRTLHAVLERVGDRGSAWVGSAAFVLVFCFGQYTVEGNYNFITPYVSQATWGFLGVLLVLEGAIANSAAVSPRAWLLAGAGLAVAWLSKAETLFAAVVVLGGLTALKRRLPPPRFWLGFVAVFAPIWLLLSVEGGVAYGFRAVNQVITLLVSPAARATLASVPIFQADLGTDAPLRNLLSHAGWGALLVGVLGCVSLAAARWQREPRGIGLAALLAAIVIGLATDWVFVGRALLLPALLTALLTGAAVLKGEKRWAPLWLLSLGAVAMLGRMGLNVRLFHYGFTMAVLATMLSIHLLVFEAPRWRLAGAEPPRLLVLIAAGLVLAASGRLTARALEMHAAKSATVGQGRDAFTAFSKEQHRNPGLVKDMLSALELYAPEARTLVVFPDSAAVSYHSRRPSPIAEFEFNPVSLGFSGGPAAVLERLASHPPDVVLLCSYDLRAHGTPFFGATERSGQEIAAWVQRNYRKVASGPAGPFNVTGHTWDLLVKRAEPAP